MTALVPTVKTPMAFAAMILSELCDRIDDGVEPSVALIQAFKETRLDLAGAVDRRIAFDNWIQGQIRTSKEARDVYAERARKLEAAHEAFKKQTAGIIEEHPDLPYEGQLGKLAVQPSPPRLDLAFALKTKSIRREIDDETIAMFGVDATYVKTETTQVLDTDAVKAALNSGVELPWAKIEQGSHLRIRR